MTSSTVPHFVSRWTVTLVFIVFMAALFLLGLRTQANDKEITSAAHHDCVSIQQIGNAVIVLQNELIAIDSRDGDSADRSLSAARLKAVTTLKSKIPECAK